jgi:hypothetical protein
MFNLTNDQITQLIVIVGVAVLLIFLIKTYYYDSAVKSTGSPTPTHEGFYDYDELSPVESFDSSAHKNAKQHMEPFVDTQSVPTMAAGRAGPQASDPISMLETNRSVNESGEVSNLGQYMPQECYPKDILSSKDLLPGGADSTWAQVVPAGQGALTDQNFLTAGHHLGMNTVGNSLRNASHDLRSEIPNPQAQVSPWNQTTIGPDLMRRPLDGC